jgi:hypothetical protein
MMVHSLEEKNELLQRLDNAWEELTAAVSGLSESQANFKPSPEAWSVAGIVEHLATVETFVLMRIEKIASEPDAGTFGEADVVFFDRVTDRSSKFQAPERVQPTGKPLASSLARLRATRAGMVELIRSAPDGHFRKHSMAHPAFGPLDGHQWILFVAGHCTRHTRQILETKAGSNFPQG